MKLAVQMCVGLAVVTFVLGILVLMGLPLRPWGLQPVERLDASDPSSPWIVPIRGRVRVA